MSEDTGIPPMGAGPTETISEPHDPSTGQYMSRAEVEALLKERDDKHAKETATLRAALPQAQVPANGGGPGNDNHQTSWSLAEQEAAARGETLDHWDVPD